MTETNEEILQDNEYKVKLENFEGPLYLLLEIIKDNKMDIETVKLADITEQYLEYIKDIETLDMENASEFITVAATLIEIKSKSLLPRDPVEVPEEEDPERQLIARLKELKLFQEASQKLQTIENVDRMYKEPDKMANNVRVTLKDMVLDKLLDAFALMMARTEKKSIVEEPKTISKDRFTVAEKIVSIKNAVREKRIVKFSELFEEDQTKSELVNIFLALLELLKLQFVKAQQSEIFGEIDIIANEENLPNE
ncbi:MAG: segregation/condensation protein A [Clostridia bacterium]|nr:segregation/condensation protein A [Clostridia bacterium]